MFKYSGIFLGLVLLAFLASCAGVSQFSEYKKMEFSTVAVGSKEAKDYEFVNDSGEDQHLLGIAFDPGTNKDGNFTLDNIKIDGTAVENEDVIIPAGKSLWATVTYAPRKFEETSASYGGWKTGKDANKKADENEEEAQEKVQRAILTLVYDQPNEGIIQLELIGKAGPGELGEEMLEEGLAYYEGNYAIDLPGILPESRTLNVKGELPIKIDGETATVNMDDFPLLYVVVLGSEPNSPIKGIDFSVIITGEEDKVATGKFDGANLEINGLSLRIRGAAGKVKEEEINPSFSKGIDFVVDNVKLKTVDSYQDGKITLQLKVILPEKPSKIPALNEAIGGIEATITMQGKLILPTAGN